MSSVTGKSIYNQTRWQHPPSPYFIARHQSYPLLYCSSWKSDGWVIFGVSVDIKLPSMVFDCGSQEISWASGMDFPTPPSFWWSTNTILIFTEAVGAYRMIQQSFRMECISQKLAKMAQRIVPSWLLISAFNIFSRVGCGTKDKIQM